MIFSPKKQSGVVFVLPILWIAVAIGFVSVKVLKSNESPSADVYKMGETYKQAELVDTELPDVSLTEEE